MFIKTIGSYGNFQGVTGYLSEGGLLVNAGVPMKPGAVGREHKSHESGSRRVGGNPGATREPGSWRTGIRGACGRRSGIGGRRDQGATDGGINNTKDARPQLMRPDPPAGCGLPTARRGDTGPPPRTEGHGAAPGHGTGGRPRTGGHGVHATRAGRARRRPTRTAPHGSYMSSAHHMS